MGHRGHSLRYSKSLTSEIDLKTDFLRKLNENERNGNDCYLAGGGHGDRDCWRPSLAEMSFEEVPRNVEMRMNGVDDPGL